MADKNKKDNSKIDALYQWISYDLQSVKGELMGELKVSSAQIASMYESIKSASDSSSGAIAQEIRYSYKQNQNIYEGIATLVKTEVAERLNAMDEKLTSLEKLESILSEISDLKYSYMQLQTIYESLSSVVSGEVVPKLDALTEKGAMLDAMEATLQEISAKLADGVGISEEDAKRIVEESVSVHSQQVLDAVAAIPVAENVDYARITEEVGDKVLELLNEVKGEPTEIDYERVAGDTAAKVVESLPPVEAVDYNRIDESIAKAVAASISADAIAAAVAAAVNVDAIAEAVAEKLATPMAASQSAASAVDYDKLADLVVEKLAAKGISADVILDEEGIDKIAGTVAERVGTVDNIDYDKVCLAAQAAQVLPDPIDYDRVAEIVEDKLAKCCDGCDCTATIDDASVEKIVSGVADELRNMTLVCEYDEAAAEEAPVEEVVEEAPVVEEVVEEAPVEEVVEEAPTTEAAEEIAVTSAPVYEEGLDGELIDAETGLVVRLKRSFTAKMKQSDEKVKAYYSDIKNEMTSYKRINSNVSWHGDRFNYGRDTVAKIGINGKTLCFYLALDPNDPELKQTVYHQKDVGAQKAYESTPFMVKVKSDAALKKALRLVAILAEKLGAEKDEKFEAVDYIAEYAYESTKSLFEAGYIKATKEKKVDFNF